MFRKLLVIAPLLLTAFTALQALPIATATCPPNPDFMLSANPNAITVARPATTTSMITVTSLCGFSGTVVFTTSISPSPTNAPTSYTNPGAIVIVSGSSDSTTLNVSIVSNCPPKPSISNPYTITISGQSGGLTQSVTIKLNVLP